MSSRFAVSEPPEQTIEATWVAILEREGCRSTRLRIRSPPIAFIQATLPPIVDISPLCATDQNGWALRHIGPSARLEQRLDHSYVGGLRRRAVQQLHKPLLSQVAQQSRE